MLTPLPVAIAIPESKIRYYSLSTSKAWCMPVSNYNIDMHATQRPSEQCKTPTRHHQGKKTQAIMYIAACQVTHGRVARSRQGTWAVRSASLDHRERARVGSRCACYHGYNTGSVEWARTTPRVRSP